MKLLLSRYNYFFLLLLIFTVSEIVVNPIGDFPLNDDWSYGKALHYTLTKSFTIGHFGAMSLFTHLAWGMLFVKVFGFSFTVLRISTFISVIISMFFLDKIIFGMTKNKIAGFFACLVLLFNPLYFNLSNTYMTDVNFNTLLILCAYYAFRFFDTRISYYFIPFFLFSILMVLLRQFGVIVPVCFTLACLCIVEKRWKWILISVAGTILAIGCLSWYESYLKTILPADAAYKFSGGIQFSDSEFRKLVYYYFGLRYKVLMLQVAIYLAPFAAFYLLSLARSVKTNIAAGVIVVNSAFIYWFFKEVEFPFHNIFQNMWLGPETFYESTMSTPHSYSPFFGSVLLAIKYCFTTITTSTLSLAAIAATKTKVEKNTLRPEIVFLISFLMMYAAMLFITESYFDRYFIPLLTISLIWMSFLAKKHLVNYAPAFVLLACSFYVSVFGTKDYLSWNRARWDAFNYLVNNKNVTAEQVNGGFEINCWNDRKENWWYDYTRLDNFDYLIQFKKEEGFTLLKEYEFQRYFPFKRDKINIFVKEVKQ